MRRVEDPGPAEPVDREETPTKDAFSEPDACWWCTRAPATDGRFCSDRCFELWHGDRPRRGEPGYDPELHR